MTANRRPTAAGRGTVQLDLLPDAETAIVALLGVVIGFDEKDHGYMSLVIDGDQHTPRCAFGQWLTPGGPRPEGDPCSERCVTARAAVDMALEWLGAHAPARRPATRIGRTAG
jgi:hypothetical protein